MLHLRDFGMLAARRRAQLGGKLCAAVGFLRNGHLLGCCFTSARGLFLVLTIQPTWATTWEAFRHLQDQDADSWMDFLGVPLSTVPRWLML